MTFPKDDSELHEELTAAFAPPPAADFEAWRRQHAEAVAFLNPQRTNIFARRRTIMRRALVFAATAAILACAWLGLSHFPASEPGSTAFAQTIGQIQKAKTITWKETFYEHITSKDGKTWLHTGVTEWAYRAPGLYRKVRTKDEGQPHSVEITDTAHGRQLTYYPSEKKATVAEINGVSHDSGPFAYYLEKLNAPNLQWVGKQETATGEVNVFRCAFRDHDNERDWSIDYWIDAKTKQLVAVYQPGADIYDLQKDPARNNEVGKRPWSYHVMGGGRCEIRSDISLDESLFQLEPPEGYTLEVKQRDRITEKEMVDYLGILAEFNDKMFPDQAFPTPFNLMSKINRALKKPQEELTEAERILLDTDLRYSWRFGTVHGAPILVFFDWDPDSIVKNSFRYLGKGVKLGEKDRIVCWYKLKDAKNPDTYRVVYGDLSVKDVSPEELPLKVEP